MLFFVLPVMVHNKSHLEKERVSDMGLFSNDSSPFKGGNPCSLQAQPLGRGHPVRPERRHGSQSLVLSPVTAGALPVSSLLKASTGVATVQLSPCPGWQNVRILSHYLSYPLQGAQLEKADSSAFWCVGCFLLTEPCLHNFLGSLSI